MSIVFFDGVCNLCNAFADFIIRHDRDHVFHIASLQGQTAKNLLPASTTKSLQTIILLEHGQLLDESTAVLHIFAQLPGAWKWLHHFESLPKPLRDGTYHFIARNRYKIFGRRDSCRIPTADESRYFLP